jgi:hypothetical protein
MSTAGVQYLTALIKELVVVTDDFQEDDIVTKLFNTYSLRTAYNGLYSWSSYRDRKKDADLTKVAKSLVENMAPFLGSTSALKTEDSVVELKKSFLAGKEYVSKKTKKVFHKQVFGGWELIKKG